MEVFTDEKQSTVQNLKDAGCTEEFIEKFMGCFSKDRTGDQLRILQKQRDHLLDDIHTAQKKLDCLDFLIYKIRKAVKKQVDRR